MYFLFCCSFSYLHFVFFFFFNDTATTEIYTLSLHDALPIYIRALLDEVPAQVEPSAVGGIADHDAALHELRRPRRRAAGEHIMVGQGVGPVDERAVAEPGGEPPVARGRGGRGWGRGRGRGRPGGGRLAAGDQGQQQGEEAHADGTD